jgi:hypothetical protein
VFLTGGSSFVPAVRRIFETRFGPDLLAGGENFQSVAFGLAPIGLEDDLDPWLARECGGKQSPRAHLDVKTRCSRLHRQSKD